MNRQLGYAGRQLGCVRTSGMDPRRVHLQGHLGSMAWRPWRALMGISAQDSCYYMTGSSLRRGHECSSCRTSLEATSLRQDCQTDSPGGGMPSQVLHQAGLMTLLDRRRTLLRMHNVALRRMTQQLGTGSARSYFGSRKGPLAHLEKLLLGGGGWHGVKAQCYQGSGWAAALVRLVAPGLPLAGH